MAQVQDAEIERLVAFYRRAVKELARDFIEQVTLDDARVLSLVRSATRILDLLDRRAAAWANRNLVGIYNEERRETAAMLKARGLSLREVGAASQYAVVNRQAIEALILDPEVGFYSGMREATNGIRRRLRLIRSQARVLQAQQQTINETIARVGILRGSTVTEVKNAIVRELTTSKAKADLVWKPRATALGPRHILGNLANLPYVTTPSGRNLRLDRYAEMVTRTKSRQATALAQRNTMVEHGQGLVSISRNLSKDDDACNLYVGRVFALTDEAAEEFDVPHIDLLPGGGAPFHPNCTHNEVPFFPELMKESIVERATSKPPSWALGRPWGEVQKEYLKRGGNAYGNAQNPNLQTAQNSGGRQRKQAKNAKAVEARRRKKAAMAKKKEAG